jgi:predicted enzyme related to lactoylglutathione lyase
MNQHPLHSEFLMAPTLANGKICYLELPSLNVSQSAAFYSNVFGWSMRTRGDGAEAFDDTTGEVSGAFVLGRKRLRSMTGTEPDVQAPLPS